MKLKSLVVAMALGAALVPCSQATLISVNFQGGRDPGTGPDVTGTAGYVPAGNWNNATGLSGASSDLTDSNGANSGASISWSTFNTWDLQNGDGNGGDRDMMSGYLDNFNGNVTVSNVPYERYNVYVYFNRGVANSYTGITAGDGVTTETLYGKDNGNSFAVNGFLLSTDDSVTTDDATWTVSNVMQFSDFTGSTLTITPPANPGIPGTAGANWKVFISGVQIQAVPEPSSLVLLAAGGVMLLSALRRSYMRSGR